MKSMTLLSLLIVLLIAVFGGCSSSNNPLAPDSALPENILGSADIQSGTGILGAYSVALDTSTLEYEMVPIRHGAIGESLMVEGVNLFTWFPCAQCFYIDGIKGDASGVTVDFYVRHPLNAGNPANPPSGANRLDLDVFDLSIVIWPDQSTRWFANIGRTVLADFCVNPSGYTTDLSNVLFPPQNNAVPYYLVVDDTTTGISTFNKFAMGTARNVNVSIAPSSTVVYFDVYLTMGYGASATFWQRVTPKYYNPEFNKKAAWKVIATPQDHWPNDSFAPVAVRVEVYDWQQGATVYSNPADYANAPINQIYSASNVQEVQVDVLGMANWIFSATASDSGTGMPGDPLIYTVWVGNYNYLPNGTYLGLVKVIDSRVPETNINNNRDYIVSTIDGRVLTKHLLPEYATYQTFIATVG
jgi:hypothetical protein